MKRVALLLFLAGWLVPLASAQDHFQVGAYADYFRISQTKTNMAGLGARVGHRQRASPRGRNGITRLSLSDGGGRSGTILALFGMLSMEFSHQRICFLTVDGTD